MSSKIGVTAIEEALPTGSNAIGKLAAGSEYIGKVRKSDGTTDEKLPTDVVNVNGAAVGGLSILAAGGAGIKNRVFRIVLVSNAITTLTLSDGLGVYYVAVGVPIVLDYKPIGKVQSTANTAITVTSADAANVGVLCLYSTE